MTAFFNSLLSVTAGASLLIVLVLLLSALLGKRYSTKWRYFAWLFIAIRLIVPFEIPLNASIFTFSVPEESTYVSYTPEQNKGTATNPDKIVIEPDKSTENITQTPTNTTPVTPPTTIIPSENDNIIIQTTPIEDVVEVNPVKTISYTAIFSIIWLVGAAACLVVYTVAHVRFIGNIRLWNRPVTEPWAVEIFKNVKQEMGITKDIKLYRNRSVHSPILAGFFKPMVLIPTRNITENDLYMVLRHELQHYKRRDLWYKLVLVLTGCLHWFNPLVWFMVKRADRDLEISCDEAVVKGTSMEFRRDYCDTILRIIRFDRGRKPALSTGFTTGKKTMKQRFACALDFSKKRTGVIVLCFVLCAAILCSTFIACDITKKGPEQYYDEVLYFAERIPQTFNSPAELENSLVSIYLFEKITSANGLLEAEDGSVSLTQTEINNASKFLLGLDEFVPDREGNMYFADTDSYKFYPFGEGTEYTGEIVSAEKKNDNLYYTVKLTQKVYGGADEPAVTPKVYVITYAFTENENDTYPLKAVKAEHDAEYIASIDVKGIGVLGYVDNKGTLPTHSVTLSEKLSDVNSFMFKKLRVCEFDAEKNGYIVHYYDYTEGDDALNLALAVESIVKGSGLNVNTAKVEKSFVVVDLIPTGEAVDNTKVKELLESIACTNDTNGYYLTGFTLLGGQFDFGGITLENDGYGKYEFEPLFNQPITTAELSAMRNLLIYPFTDDIGIPIYAENTVAFADDVTDKNDELASLIYHTAGCNPYANFSQLSDNDKASIAIGMIPDTYDCMNVPEKWSEVVVNADDYIYLKPLMTVISDFEFVTKEWVELAVKQLWGEDAEIIHPSSTLGKWTYRTLEGVYTPFHGGEGSDTLPYIHSVTKTPDGYVAEVSYVTVNIEGAHGRDTNETIVTYDLFDNEEVVELAKRQNKYLVTAKYDDNGKLYLVSCQNNNYVEISADSRFTVVSDATTYNYLDTIKVRITNNTNETIDFSSSYCLLKKGENGWLEVKYETNKPNFNSAQDTLEGGESSERSIELLGLFENLEDGWYCFAIGPSGNGTAKKVGIVSNEFYITNYVQDSAVVAENREDINPTAVAITYDYDSKMYIATLYGRREKEQFTFSHEYMLLPSGLKGSLSLDGNVATITTDYCGVVMVVDFDKETFEISYNFKKSDMEYVLDTSASGRYTLYYAGFTGAGDAGYSNVVLYDNNDKSYSYICYGGGMYGGGFEAGFLRNEDIYCTSLGELKIYDSQTKQLKLDVGENFELGFFEEEQMHRELLTFRRDPNDFSFIVVYFEVENGYETKEVTDSLGIREELPTTYRIGYLDKDGNLLESYDTGVNVWLGRYNIVLEASMRYSTDTLTLIVGNEDQGFTGTFDTTTHEFKTK